MKLESGYIGSHPPLVLKQFAKVSSHQKQRDDAAHGGKREGQVPTREEEGNGGETSRQVMMMMKKSGEDELVDGWPHWLTDVVPRELLVGLVKKSADSYHKLNKV